MPLIPLSISPSNRARTWPKTLRAYNAYFIDANLLVTLTVLLFCRFFGGYVSVLCCRPPSLVSPPPLGGPAGAATFGGLQPAGAIGIQAAPSPASYLSPLPQIRPRPRQRQGGQVRTRGGGGKGGGLRRVIQSSICSTCSAGGAFRFVFLRHILHSFLLIVRRRHALCAAALWCCTLVLGGICRFRGIVRADGGLRLLRFETPFALWKHRRGQVRPLLVSEFHPLFSSFSDRLATAVRRSRVDVVRGCFRATVPVPAVATTTRTSRRTRSTVPPRPGQWRSFSCCGTSRPKTVSGRRSFLPSSCRGVLFREGSEEEGR